MGDLTQSAYDKYARELAEVYEENAQEEEFLSFLKGLGRGARVLDVGCASGFLAPIAVQAGVYYAGVDRSAELIRIAPSDTDARVADVRALPFPDYSFDGVWCVAVLQHLRAADLLTALQEIVRVLKPDGVCRVSMEQGSGEYVDSIGRGYYRILEDELREYLAQLPLDGIEFLGTTRLRSFNGAEPDKQWLSFEFARDRSEAAEIDDDCPLCPSNDWPNFEEMTGRNPLRYVHGSPSGYLSVDVSPIAPEHLLYVPTRHTLSLAKLHEWDLDHAMGCVDEVGECCRAIQDLSSKHEVVIAEHGPVCRRPGHTCIAHTHLHIVRLETPQLAALESLIASNGYVEAPDLLEAPPLEADYVAFKLTGSGRTFLSKEREHPSQELRRLIGEVTGVQAYRWQDMSKDPRAEQWRESSLTLLRRISSACLHRSEMEVAR